MAVPGNQTPQLLAPGSDSREKITVRNRLEAIRSAQVDWSARDVCFRPPLLNNRQVIVDGDLVCAPRARRF